MRGYVTIGYVTTNPPIRAYERAYKSDHGYIRELFLS